MLTSECFQAITPTMILVLAGLHLTSNDVHSRLTRSQQVKGPMRPGLGHMDTTRTIPLDTMQFASSDTDFSRSKSMMDSILPDNSYKV